MLTFVSRKDLESEYLQERGRGPSWRMKDDLQETSLRKRESGNPTPHQGAPGYQSHNYPQEDHEESSGTARASEVPPLVPFRVSSRGPLLHRRGVFNHRHVNIRELMQGTESPVAQKKCAYEQER